MFHLDFAGFLVDHHQFRREAILDQQDLVEADGLAGVDLGARGRIVVPDDFLLRRHLFDLQLAGEQDMPVGEHPDIVDFAAASGGPGPHHLAVVDQEDGVITFAGVEHGVLGEAASRPLGDAGRVGPVVGNGGALGWSGGRDVGCGELIEDAEQGRRRWRAGRNAHRQGDGKHGEAE